MENPLVSVIIPTYNRANVVVKAINSVLSQTYKNIEIIVVDDGSKDNTFEKLSKEYKGRKNVIILNNGKNLGFVKNQNKGIAVSHGKYVARLDDDDAWIDKNKLEKQINFLENNKDFVLAGSGVIKINGKMSEKYLPPENDEEIRKKILVTDVFTHSSVVFLKDIFDKAGGYKEKFGFFSDWDLWLNMGRLGKFYNFQEFFVNYSDNDNNISHNTLIRRKLNKILEMKSNYRNFYPGYKKAVLSAFLSYFYSFLPSISRIFNGKYAK